MADEAAVYEYDRTILVAAPADKPYRILAANVGETHVRVGPDMVTLRPGEDAMIEGGRIVAPKRILDERRSDLSRRLAPLSKERR